MFERRIDINIHLLSNINRQITPVEAVDDLQDSCIDTLGTIAGQPDLWHHVWLEANESQWCFDLIVTTKKSDRLEPRLVFQLRSARAMQDGVRLALLHFFQQLAGFQCGRGNHLDTAPFCLR